MKTNFKLMIAIWFAMTATSCYDVLDQVPTDRYTDAVVWNDATLLDQHLAQLYLWTPVMINDASTVMTSWGREAFDVDGRSANDYLIGYGANMEGPIRTMDIADETKHNFGAQSNLAGVKRTGLSIGGCDLRWWGNAYYTIRLLNYFIENAANSPIPNVDVRISEARFLRAFNYFAMVKRYGGVPLVTKAYDLDADESDLYPFRNTEKEVYDFILQETDEISKILPSVAEAGRANKWAALALRSRAALFAGSIAQFGTQQLNGLLGFPDGNHTAYYQICYDACTEIMTQSPHGLYNADADKVENFKNIFLHKGHNEAIMVKQHTGNTWNGGGTNNWSWDISQCPPYPSVWGVGNCNGPYLEMVEEFERIDGSSGVIDRAYAKSRVWSMEELWGDRDPRFKASIWTNGDTWPNADGGILGPNVLNLQNGIMSPDGTLIDGRFDTYDGYTAVGQQLTRYRELNVTHTGFGVMKYLDSTADLLDWFCTSKTDYIIFRYGEILLNYAEAAFELNKPADALNAVNQIRDRAGIASLSAIDREKIRHERKVELAFENHRYWDLRRWRIAVEKLTRTYTGLRYIYDAATGKYHLDFTDNIDGSTQTPTFPERNYYWPIEQKNTIANPNLVENPGY